MADIASFLTGLERFERTREWHKVPDVHFLKVFDVPWIEGERTPELPVLKGSPAELQQALQTLPFPIARCYRFFVSENITAAVDGSGGPGDTPRACRELCTEQSRSDSSSFAGLQSQWRSQGGARAWLSDSYSMLPYPLLPFTGSLIKSTKRIRVSKGRNDCVSIHITCDSMMTVLSGILEDRAHSMIEVPQLARNHVLGQLSNFSDNLLAEISRGLAKAIPDDGNAYHISTKLAMLAFCRCSVDQLLGFIEDVQHVLDSQQETSMNPRVGKPWTQRVVRKFINDTYFYEKFRECVLALTSATLPLLDLLSIDISSYSEFKHLAVETHAMCTDLKRSSAQLSSRLESSMRLFELLRSFHESFNVRLLGLLAAIFLPLSLASSLLSMQTRLVDLHYLLYDFFGVIILLGTIVIFIVVLLRLYTRLKDRYEEWKFGSNAAYIRRRVAILQYGVMRLISVAWALFLASFLVGMVKDVPLGLKILGYGTGAIGGMLSILGLIAFLTI